MGCLLSVLFLSYGADGLADGLVHRAVHDEPVVHPARSGHGDFLLGGVVAALNSRAVLALAVFEALEQGFFAGREDEDRERLRDLLLDLDRALDVYLEDDQALALELLDDLGLGGAVLLAVDAGSLQELAGGLHLLEVVVTDKVVVHALDVGGRLGAGGG